MSTTSTAVQMRWKSLYGGLLGREVKLALVETICVYTSYRFLVIASYLSKEANFNPPHLHLSPPYGVTPFEFRRDLWYQYQKTIVPGLSCGIICLILYVSRSWYNTEEWQTHRQSDRRTHRRTTTAYSALAQRRAIKIRFGG